MKYTEANEKSWDYLSHVGYYWTIPISHEDYIKAAGGDYTFYLTPSKAVPKDWLPQSFKGIRVLCLASGGGQQGPVFAALGAETTVFDLSQKQLESEQVVAKREGIIINTVKGDMTERLPFSNDSYDLIFHPVSNCYVEDIYHVWNECFRILKKGGALLAGFLTETGFLFGFDPSMKVINKMPYNPLKGLNNEEVAERVRNTEGFMFSHTLEEQIGGQIKAGLTLMDLYDDRERPDEDCGIFAEYMNTYAATRALKNDIKGKLKSIINLPSFLF